MADLSAKEAADEAFARLMGWTIKREVSAAEPAALGPDTRTTSLPAPPMTPRPQKAAAMQKVLEQSSSMRNPETAPLNVAPLGESVEKAEDASKAAGPEGLGMLGSQAQPTNEMRNAAAEKRRAAEVVYKEQKRKEAEAAAEEGPRQEAEERKRERAIAEAHVQEQKRKERAPEGAQKGAPPPGDAGEAGEAAWQHEEGIDKQVVLEKKEGSEGQAAAEEEGGADGGDERDKQERAAVLIQARGRGMLARKEHEQRLNGAQVKAMADAERMAAEGERNRSEAREKEDQKNHRAAEDGERAAAQGDEADSKMEEEKAATMIQAQMRGRLARKEVSALKAKGEEKAAGAEEAAAKRRAEEERAATMIQAQARGRQARKEVEAVKAKKEQEVGAAKEEEAKSRAEEEKAATMIQAQARGRLVRKELGALKAKAAGGGSAGNKSAAGPAPQPEEAAAPAPAERKAAGMSFLDKIKEEIANEEAGSAAAPAPRANGVDTPSPPVPLSTPPTEAAVRTGATPRLPPKGPQGPARAAPNKAAVAEVTAGGSSTSPRPAGEPTRADTKAAASPATTSMEPEALRGCWATFCWIFGVHG